MQLLSYDVLLSPLGPIFLVPWVPYSAVFLDANICFQIIITYTKIEMNPALGHLCAHIG